MLLVLAKIDEPGRQAILQLHPSSRSDFKQVVVALAATCRQRLVPQSSHSHTSSQQPVALVPAPARASEDPADSSPTARPPRHHTDQSVATQTEAPSHDPSGPSNASAAAHHSGIAPAQSHPSGLARAALLAHTPDDGSEQWSIVMDRLTDYQVEVINCQAELRKCQSDLAACQAALISCRAETTAACRALFSASSSSSHRPTRTSVSVDTSAQPPHSHAPDASHRQSTSAQTEARAALEAKSTTTRLSDHARQSVFATPDAQAERATDLAFADSPGQARRSARQASEVVTGQRLERLSRVTPGSSFIDSSRQSGNDTSFPPLFGDQDSEDDSEAEALAEYGDDAEDEDDAQDSEESLGDFLDRRYYERMRATRVDSGMEDSMARAEAELEYEPIDLGQHDAEDETRQESLAADTTLEQADQEGKREEVNEGDDSGRQGRSKRVGTSTYYRQDRRHRDGNRNVRKAHAQSRQANGKFAPKQNVASTTATRQP